MVQDRHTHDWYTLNEHSRDEGEQVLGIFREVGQGSGDDYNFSFAKNCL